MPALVPYKQLLSIAAGFVTFAAFFPYVRSILRGGVTPHVFSWIIWGTTTFLVFFAQMAAGAGIGAWPIGLSGAISIAIAFLAYQRRGDSTISRIDWCFFVGAMASLPVWYLTSDPTLAVVVLTMVDLLGFGPTVRKAHSHPYSESLVFFGLFTARNGMVLIALESYSVATVLFPLAIGIACICLMLLIAFRRTQSVAHGS